jgi:hypothetical protein
MDDAETARLAKIWDQTAPISGKNVVLMSLRGPFHVA